MSNLSLKEEIEISDKITKFVRKNNGCTTSRINTFLLDEGHSYFNRYDDNKKRKLIELLLNLNTIFGYKTSQYYWFICEGKRYQIHKVNYNYKYVLIDIKDKYGISMMNKKEAIFLKEILEKKDKEKRLRIKNL